VLIIVIPITPDVTAENADYVAHQIEEEDFQATMNNLLKKS
jgi:hypothetical protein